MPTETPAAPRPAKAQARYVVLLAPRAPESDADTPAPAGAVRRFSDADAQTLVAAGDARWASPADLKIAGVTPTPDA